MANPKKKPTIKDVATLAGVSPSTVSLVLNGKCSSLPEKTCERVRRAAQELGYSIDLNARALITRKTNIIGVIIPDISNGFFAESVRYMQLAFSERGYDIILCNSEERADNDFRYVQLLAGRNVDGLVYSPSAETLQFGKEQSMHELLQSLNLPYIFYDRYYKGDEPKVVIDNAQSGYEATKYLLENGHEKIGVISGPFVLNSSRNRLRGFKKAMEEKGVEFFDDLVYEGKYDLETGYEGGKKLIEKGVTAIFAFSDVQAYGVYEMAKERGLHIPNDLSVMGFDDSIFSTLLETPLTTMRQPIKTIAHEVCRVILDLIEENQTDVSVRLPAEIVKRNSVKKIN